MSTRLTGYRRVRTRGQDTLQAVAARELGDARLWHDLVELNGLIPPFITDDPALAGPKVLLAGAEVLVPAPSAPSTGVATDAEADILGTDILLVNGKMQVGPSGDLATASGPANMAQAVRHVVVTNPGDLLYHRDYGSGVRTLIGDEANGVTNRLAASFVRRALIADPRIARTRGIEATVVGDRIAVEGDAMTVDDRLVPVGL